jgi:hypothetical protein
MSCRPAHTAPRHSPCTPPLATPRQVTAEQRNCAKQVTYGILYGMGSHTLAEKLGCSCPEADKFRTEFLLRFKSAWAGRALGVVWRALGGAPV